MWCDVCDCFAYKNYFFLLSTISDRIVLLFSNASGSKFQCRNALIEINRTFLLQKVIKKKKEKKTAVRILLFYEDELSHFQTGIFLY